jgi:hypothetical protein
MMVGAMEDAHERRRAYDRAAQSLVGLRLATVRYVEIDYASMEYPAPAYDRMPDVDSLDYGLDLAFEGGRVVGFTWGQEFEMYDLELAEGGIPKGDAAVWDVSETSRWRSFVGSRINRVEVEWIEDEERSVVLSGRSARIPLLLLRRSLLKSIAQPASPSPLADPMPEGLSLRARLGRRVLDWALGARGEVEVRQRMFPLAVCLHFRDQRVWIAILEVMDDGEPFHCADTVTVAFDEDVALRLELSV